MQMLVDGLREAIRLLLAADPHVIAAAWRSLWISVTAVLLASIASIPLGICLAHSRFVGRTFFVVIFRSGMAIPTVFIGLVCFALFSRRGPIGDADLLYTPWAILCGEVILATPLIVSLTHSAIRALDPRIAETARTLGAGRLRTSLTCLMETKTGITLALLTAFSRCVTELGIAMMVGGNIKDRTRTLTTATALETSRGEFARGVAMGVILLLVAVGVMLLTMKCDSRGDRNDD